MSQEELRTFPIQLGNEEEELMHYSDDENEASDGFDILSDVRWDQTSITNALELCKKYILTPYSTFLKGVGWRKFGSKRDQIPCYIYVCNFLYPLFIFTMLVFACVSQVTSCFSRSRSLPPTPIKESRYSILQCNEHLMTSDMLLYLLILGSYWGAFYIFRFSEAEHLSSLSETVFISFNFVSGRKRRTSPVFVLISFLISGIVWFLLSGTVNILRLVSLGLHKDTTIIEWFTTNSSAPNQMDYLKIAPVSYSALHYICVCCSLLGFIFFDFLYIAVVINYCTQCQLLTFYVQNVKDKVLNKKYKTLNGACKEVFHVYEFLRVLNGKLAYVMTMILFIFAYNVISSYRYLVATGSDSKENITLGFLNVIQWLSALAFPIALATRFTAVSNQLRSLGLQISSRPFVYSDTPDLELQFFLNFMDTTNYQARLAFIPMYPSLVLGFSFVFVLLFSLGIGISHINAIKWF